MDVSSLSYSPALSAGGLFFFFSCKDSVASLLGDRNPISSLGSEEIFKMVESNH